MTTTVSEARAEQPTPHRPRTRSRRKRLTPWMMLAPATVVLLVMTGYPLVKMAINSFQKYGKAQIFGAPPEWIGLKNYLGTLADPTFWAVAGRSFTLMAVLVIATMSLGILIALLMMRVNAFFRLLISIGLLLAWAMPPVSSVVVWGWIVDTKYGLLNWVLNAVTGTTDWSGHSWLIDPLSFYAVLTVIITWMSVPFVAFTVYAGLTQVPDEVLEAAQLDGAGAVKRFGFIVLPYLRSILLITAVLQMIWDLRVFTQVYTLQGLGGISSQTDVFGTYIFHLGSSNLGAAGAVSFIMVAMMLLISIYYVSKTVKDEEI
ncbi:carbohydrate ABC transporter permease [Paramicrobacterium chengjingii]|uniref:Sugar ABC transporter permease n=1 Tax=Paramicrobacterium chengjingii TaxID=2769067 RepID=A0ABX6YLE1_9MICO|nr:sugar ABC transporter permease [Microbacterium chengjingii]QPZ39226.1 sugar ABC transporter permease [Microbacterium chengjingii]